MVFKIVTTVGILFVIFGISILVYFYLSNYAIFSNYESLIYLNKSKITTYQDYIDRINFERTLLIVSSVLILLGCILCLASFSFKFSKYIVRVKREFEK